MTDPSDLPDESGFVQREASLDRALLGGASPLILIAEDNRVAQIVAERFVAKLGFKSRLAKDGAIAVHMAVAQPFELILMDVSMPVMDGLAATRAIRGLEQREGRRPSPIFGVTAYDSPEDRQACCDAGMNGHLTKPLVFDHLLHLVSDLGLTRDGLPAETQSDANRLHRAQR